MLWQEVCATDFVDRRKGPGRINCRALGAFMDAAKLVRCGPGMPFFRKRLILDFLLSRAFAESGLPPAAHGRLDLPSLYGRAAGVRERVNMFLREHTSGGSP